MGPYTVDENTRGNANLGDFYKHAKDLIQALGLETSQSDFDKEVRVLKSQNRKKSKSSKSKSTKSGAPSLTPQPPAVSDKRFLSDLPKNIKEFMTKAFLWRDADLNRQGEHTKKVYLANLDGILSHLFDHLHLYCSFDYTEGNSSIKRKQAVERLLEKIAKVNYFRQQDNQEKECEALDELYEEYRAVKKALPYRSQLRNRLNEKFETGAGKNISISKALKWEHVEKGKILSSLRSDSVAIHRAEEELSSFAEQQGVEAQICALGFGSVNDMKRAEGDFLAAQQCRSVITRDASHEALGEACEEFSRAVSVDAASLAENLQLRVRQYAYEVEKPDTVTRITDTASNPHEYPDSVPGQTRDSLVKEYKKLKQQLFDHSERSVSFLQKEDELRRAHFVRVKSDYDKMIAGGVLTGDQIQGLLAQNRSEQEAFEGNVRQLNSQRDTLKQQHLTGQSLLETGFISAEAFAASKDIYVLTADQRNQKSKNLNGELIKLFASAYKKSSLKKYSDSFSLFNRLRPFIEVNARCRGVEFVEYKDADGSSKRFNDSELHNQLAHFKRALAKVYCDAPEFETLYERLSKGEHARQNDNEFKQFCAELLQKLFADGADGQPSLYHRYNVHFDPMQGDLRYFDGLQSTVPERKQQSKRSDRQKIINNLHSEAVEYSSKINDYLQSCEKINDFEKENCSTPGELTFAKKVEKLLKDVQSITLDLSPEAGNLFEETTGLNSDLNQKFNGVKRRVSNALGKSQQLKDKLAEIKPVDGSPVALRVQKLKSDCQQLIRSLDALDPKVVRKKVLSAYLINKYVPYANAQVNKLDRNIAEKADKGLSMEELFELNNTYEETLAKLKKAKSIADNQGCTAAQGALRAQLKRLNEIVLKSLNQLAKSYFKSFGKEKLHSLKEALDTCLEQVTYKIEQGIRSVGDGGKINQSAQDFLIDFKLDLCNVAAKVAVLEKKEPEHVTAKDLCQPYSDLKKTFTKAKDGAKKLKDRGLARIVKDFVNECGRRIMSAFFGSSNETIAKAKIHSRHKVANKSVEVIAKVGIFGGNRCPADLLSQQGPRQMTAVSG